MSIKSQRVPLSPYEEARLLRRLEVAVKQGVGTAQLRARGYTDKQIAEMRRKVEQQEKVR